MQMARVEGDGGRGVSARLGCVIEADAGISTKYENIV